MGDRVVLALAALVAVVVVVGGAVVVLTREPADPQAAAQAAADAFATDWAARDAAAMRAAMVDGGAFTAEAAALWDALDVVSVAVDAGFAFVDGSVAQVRTEVVYALADGATVAFTTDLAMVRERGVWGVQWRDGNVLAGWEPGLAVERTEVPVSRAPITAVDGTPMTTPGELVVIGIEPRRMTDADEVVRALVDHAGLAEEDVRRTVDRDDLVPDWFYPIVTVRPERNAELRPLLFPVPGIVFRTTAARLTPADGFAAHVLGRVGEATAERLAELGPPYAPGDAVGLSGLERAFEERLAGRPSTRYALTRPDGTLVRVLTEVPGVEPEPLRTTLDVATQEAAEAAMAEVGTGALVVVDVATGAIRATVSRPLDAFDRALSGLYAPASAFGVVTAAAVLERAPGPDVEVDCPAEVVVGGLRVANAARLDLGATTLREAVARSCDTSLARLAADLPDGALETAAARFGYGTSFTFPLDVALGRFPAPADLAERAGAAIGQARVQSSPLHLATIAAAVADGSWRAPTLLADDDPGEVRVLPAGVLPGLRQVLRAAVTDGTASALAGVQPPVHGLTGTASVPGGDAAGVHAVFLGYRDTVAVGVVVEGGGSAVPVAQRFFAALDAAASQT